MQSIPLFIIGLLSLFIIYTLTFGRKGKSLRILIIQCIPVLSKKILVHQQITTVLSIGLTLTAAILFGKLVGESKEAIAAIDAIDEASIIETNTSAMPFSKPKQILDAQVIPQRRVEEQPIFMNNQFYIQLAALNSLEKAKKEQQRWENENIFLPRIATDNYSYKILIGPFPDAETARRYIRQQKLKGYPRSTRDLHFFGK